MNKFEEFGLSNELLESIKRQNIVTPTEIQAGSIGPILKGQDVVGESATGSGKTLAFGCGIIESVVPRNGIQALVLTPTRELCEQVSCALQNFSGGKRLNVLSIYGGVSIDRQIYNLPKTDVVVATPGRLLDHLQRGTINLSKVKILVLDEADRMLDMGFIDDVERIIRACPKDRQTMFFSATICSKIKELSKHYMNNPIKVMAKREVDPTKLKQVYYDVHKSLKLSLLVHLLNNEKEGLMMVFCNTRRQTDFVVKNLKTNGIDAIAIHGGLSQNKRSKTLDMFNGAKVEVLVCTDVAARGLHIDNVSHVYNYEIPNDPKDYVHRIGRTARAGEKGKVVNLLCEYDHENFGRVQDFRTFALERLETPQVEKVRIVQVEARQGFGARRNSGRGGFGGGRSFGRGTPRRNSGPQRGFGPRRR
ncbi:DEAD/DEAH box helicase [archaeon]|nr:DEAD/DEAH box helicase [archaeon]